MSFRERIQLSGMAAAAFSFTAAQVMPIGLLSGIAADFEIQTTRAAWLISAHAYVVMLLSTLLMMLLRRVEMRILLLGTLAVFGACQIISALSVSFRMLLALRIVEASAHAVFWCVATPIAARLVPEERRSAAVGVVTAGSSAAILLGLSLSRTVGWRAAFASLGILAFMLVAVLGKTIPGLPLRRTFMPRDLIGLLKDPSVAGVCALTVMTVTAYYTAYSYIEPFLKQVAHLPEAKITAILAMFGVAKIPGNVLFACFYRSFPRLFINLTAGGIAGVLLLMLPLSRHLWSAVPLYCLWGMATAVFNALCQTEIIGRTRPEATATAMSLYSGLFNFGAACGTLLGGFVCARLGISRVGFAGALIAGTAYFCCIRLLFRRPAPR